MPHIDEPHYKFGSRVKLSHTAQRGILTARDDFRRRFSLQGKGVSPENRCLADGMRTDRFCKLFINKKVSERIRHEKTAELIDSLRFLCFAKRQRTISLI